MWGSEEPPSHSMTHFESERLNPLIKSPGSVPENIGGSQVAEKEQTFKQWILAGAVSIGKATRGNDGGRMGSERGNGTDSPRDPSNRTDPFFCFADEKPAPLSKSYAVPWFPEVEFEIQRGGTKTGKTTGQPLIPDVYLEPGYGGRYEGTGAGTDRSVSNISIDGSRVSHSGFTNGGSFADEMNQHPFSGQAVINVQPQQSHGSPQPPESPPGLYRVLRFDHAKPNRDVGVGAHFERVAGKDEVRVVRMSDRGPAFKSGEVRIGDILLSVNDAEVTGKPMCDLAKLVLGAEGSKVKLELAREVGDRKGNAKHRFSVVLARTRDHA